MVKKKWAVSVTWMMAGTDYVEADTKEEAMQIAGNPGRSLPSDRCYVSDSLWSRTPRRRTPDEGCC